MKKRWRFWLWLVPAFLLAGVAAGNFYKQKEALRFVQEIGTGISLANSLDVTGVVKYETNPLAELYETYWNNPRISREQLQSIRLAGFRTVRFPVTWEEHMTEEGIVNSVWMDRVEELVQKAVEEDLYVILDTHYESWLVPSPEGEEESTRKLCVLWEQIAQRFQDYDEHLLFESMNAPAAEGEKTANIAVLNRMNAAFVKTVREAGGHNDKRYLLLPTYENSCGKEETEGMVLPEDEHLIVAVHFFIPHTFALDQRGTTKWEKTNPEDTEPVDEAMEQLERTFLERGVPVFLTEMSCIYRGNRKDREDWTAYVADRAGKSGVGYAWWDDGGKCRLLDREQGTWIWPDLVNILTFRP